MGVPEQKLRRLIALNIIVVPGVLANAFAWRGIVKMDTFATEQEKESVYLGMIGAVQSSSFLLLTTILICVLSGQAKDTTSYAFTRWSTLLKIVSVVEVILALMYCGACVALWAYEVANYYIAMGLIYGGLLA